VGTMLAKESVRKRMDSETGISYTEFTYQLLQVRGMRLGGVGDFHVGAYLLGGSILSIPRLCCLSCDM
jgi:hypothetical protein